MLATILEMSTTQ